LLTCKAGFDSACLFSHKTRLLSKFFLPNLCRQEIFDPFYLKCAIFLHAMVKILVHAFRELSGLEHFTRQYKSEKVEKIILDPDITDDITHGQQEFTFYHGYFGNYCYLPLLVYATVNNEKRQRLVAAVLLPSNIYPGKKSLPILTRIIRRLKKAFPKVEIILRADSGFALPEIYDWCEEEKNDVKYVIAIAKNSRLMQKAVPYRATSSLQYHITMQKAKLFGEFLYAADTWSQERRTVVKAERLKKGPNTRFVVTNINGDTADEIYQFYIQRGDAENRIEELKNHLKADRTSCSSFLANQFRLFLHAAAFLLFQALQDVLEGTALTKATVHTIQVKLLKIGARVKETVRRVWIHMASGFPLQKLFWNILKGIKMKFPSVVGSL